MTTDIVERLRGFADTEMPVETLAVICEAADEIERLTAALEDERAAHQVCVEMRDAAKDAILKSDDAHWTPAMRAALATGKRD